MSQGRTRGRHAGLDVPAILRAAIAVADREGLPALSMRRLGAELGVEAMALYHHIPSKEALLDGMVEELAAATPVPELDEADWQDGLRAYTRAQLANLAAHPHLVTLILSRPAVTERNLRMMETLLESLGRAGFPPAQALDIVYALNALILVHAALGTGAGGGPPPHGDTGQTSRLAGIPADRYPLLTQAARDSSDRGPTARFEFTLDALLAGFGATRGSRRRRAPSRRGA
jgi:AcrR family transcriptional regulator